MDGPGVSLTAVAGFADIATDALAAAREEIDALNVFPVPDGDTGTNMYLTMAAGRDAFVATLADQPTVPEALAALSRGALLGARGNSGVILSQMLAAVAGRVSRLREGDRRADALADALVEATEASYAAVSEPVEGTMLTVARAASEAARLLVQDPTTCSRDVFAAAAAAAREALRGTPTQLPELAEAGVVDAGGLGLCVILEAAVQTLTGSAPTRFKKALGRLPTTAESLRSRDCSVETVGGHHPAYEVMYLLDAPRDRIGGLRSRLAGLGDSLVVVGDGGLWNVHVHVDDVGAAIEAGIEAGRPHQIRISHLAGPISAARARVAARRSRGVVVVGAGPGLRSVFTQAGAVTVPGGPGRRPSTGMLLDAIRGAGSDEAIVLPNDPDSAGVAELAAAAASAEMGVTAVVIDTRSPVQGMAALVVHDPGLPLESDLERMREAAQAVRHGAVAIAGKGASLDVGECRPGDVLGLIGGHVEILGDDPDVVGTKIVERMLSDGGELVTLVAGVDDRDELTMRLATRLETSHPELDVVVYDGGQPRYLLLIGVE